MSPTDQEIPPSDLRWPGEHPELLPFLPMVYVAWSDGVLSPDERRTIVDRVERQGWLDPEARQALTDWLDPRRPPSASALEGLRDRIRTLGPDAAGETRRSLVSLGIELARTGGLAEGEWSEPRALQALHEIEEALGVVGSEAARAVLGGEAAVEPPTETREAPFDAAELESFLNASDAEVRRRVLELLAEPAFDFPLELPRAEYRERVLAALRVLADRGYGSLGYPEEYGGTGDPSRAIPVFETLAYGDMNVVVKYGVQFGLWGLSVLQLGTRRHHDRWLEDIGTLALPGCYAMTEMGHGSNVRDVETTATYDSATDEIVVHTPTRSARKDWIGNAALHGRMATVFAQLRVDGEEHGVHAVVVPIRDAGGEPLPGVTIEDRGPKEGLNGVDNGILSFDEVRVPRTHLLNRFGDVTDDGRYVSPIPSAGRRFFTMLGTLVAGRISIAAASVSAAKTGLTIAVRYGGRRRQFGPSGEGEVPLLHYRLHQRLLLPRLATTYGLHFAVRRLADDYGEAQRREGGPHEEEARRVEVTAAGLKAYASRHCVETLQACREACGGRGYAAANRFGRLKADTDVFTTFEGANPVLLQLVAKGLLTEYRDEMGDLKIWGVVKYLARGAETRISELNPLVTRKTDEDHLRDPTFHEGALRYREERLLGSVARRLKSLIDDGVDSFEAMNLCQDHLAALAEAHVERLVLDAFHAAVARAPSPGTSEALATVSSLFALSRIEDDRAWFLESGYMEGGKSKAVRALVNALCQEVRDMAPWLVDAFGIPDAVLKAPAGLSTPAG